MNRTEVEARTILRTVVGSTVHGVNVNDGIDDRDEMGICIEPMSEAMGVSAPFEQFVYRTAEEREGRQGGHSPRSQAGDLDLSIYGLRKWIRLALDGNPTILLPLFVPMASVVSMNHIGVELRNLTPKIISRRAGKRFLGYLQAQRLRIKGESGQKRIHRPELEALYGFDTKYAMHMCRLGFQGVELMETGRLSLPMQDPARRWLLNVRTGKVTFEECLEKADYLETRIKELLETSPLPPTPDVEFVETWMLEKYLLNWNGQCCRRDNDRDGNCHLHPAQAYA
jgi:predicted nucleotidyltransferase